MMGWAERGRGRLVGAVLAILALLIAAETAAVGGVKRTMTTKPQQHKNAYATMMYMGTPRDYEFYVATRVLVRSLAGLHVDADLVVIASLDVPGRWIRALEEEDGAKVVRVENMNNPYKDQANFDHRFKLTMNKLYAWSLVDYERVIMLDADNLFLNKTDELFQCGQFCAVFINPCIFHTGLFVLQPSLEVFKDMKHELEIGMENKDGADQGFLAGYFPDLLDQPMFYPPPNASKLNGQYRLPLGYQMDASYYYLRLRWSVPCGPNSVITYPGAIYLKPWYWWSWPVLPVGLQWHERRRETLGYGAELPMVIIQAVFYLGIVMVTRLARPNISKLCYRRSDKGITLLQVGLKSIAIWSILTAYIVPFFIIPRTIHPVVGWALYLHGAFALCLISVNMFLLQMLPVLMPWIGISGSLLVMAWPWYPNGIVRGLAIFGYAFCASPVLWSALVRIKKGLQISLEREQFLPKISDSSPPNGINKLY